MLYELSTTVPRTSFQIAIAEGVNQQFGLVEPRGMGRCETRPPPFLAMAEILLPQQGRVAGVTILDQKDALQLMLSVVPLREIVSGCNIVPGVFGVPAHCLHATRMDHQKD
jgi:hypothetical protein